jgi:hypothetical protein
VQAHYYLGLAYLGAGKRDRALAEVQTLRSLDKAMAEQLAKEIR